MFVTNVSTPYEELPTLVELLHWRGHNQPDQHAYTFLLDGDNEANTITYARLDQQASIIAARLQQCLAVGERALLLYPPGIEYIAAFMGCLYAGIIAVPAYPPSSNRSLGRMQSITVDSGAKIALSTTQIHAKVHQWTQSVPELAGLQWMTTDTLSQKFEPEWQPYHPQPQSLAFLQYTSGSTGTPKGVMVSHQNLIHNLAGIRRSGQFTPQSIGISWLPMFHDMGLILGVLQSLYTGYPTILMAPAAFIQQPLRWLQAISRYRGTASYAPNFAYDLCCDHIAEASHAQLDLRSWKVAANGAEPIPATTLTRFYETFAPYGLSQTTLTPVYGLAEGTLLVSSPPLENTATILTLDKEALERHQVLPQPQGQAESREIVGCGHSMQGQHVIIVNPETRHQCQHNEVGEIWVKGASIAQGYWFKPKDTADTFQAYLAESGEGPFLRTGDLGFLNHDELFITGRLKDIIIIRGHNYYPQDIERSIERCHPSLRPGCGAAFSVHSAYEERLVVVQELQRHHEETAPIIKAIRQTIAEEYEMQAYAVVLIRYGSILKTTSGKIQRRACRKAFLDNELRIVDSSILETLPSSQPLQEKKQRQILRQLAGVPWQQQKALLLQHIEEQVRIILQLAADEPLSAQENLLTLGMDSLKAGQLLSALQSQLEIELPGTLIFTLDEPSIATLSDYLFTELSTVGTIATTVEPIPDANTLNTWLAEFASLSEDETEAHLRQQLAAMSGDTSIQQAQKAAEESAGREINSIIPAAEIKGDTYR